MKLSVTGRPGIGKTTVCRRVADRYGGEVGGMLCGEVEEGGHRTGFVVEDLSTGETGVLAEKGGPGPRVGSYGVNVEDLEGVGVAAVERALDEGGLVVIDEVGPMELKSGRFVEAVDRALDGDVDVLFVVHARSGHPAVERVREESEVFEVTRMNRDELPGRILGAFRG